MFIFARYRVTGEVAAVIWLFLKSTILARRPISVGHFVPEHLTGDEIHCRNFAECLMPQQRIISLKFIDWVVSDDVEIKRETESGCGDLFV